MALDTIQRGIDSLDFTIDPETESVANSTTTSITEESETPVDRESTSTGEPTPAYNSRYLFNRSSDNQGSNLGNFNAVEYLVESLNNALDSLELDRSLVLQSQISGEINSTSKEILALMDVLQEKIESHIEKYENAKNVVIPELMANLSKSQKTADKLTAQIKQMFPVEYSKSKDKILNRVSDEDEDLYV